MKFFRSFLSLSARQLALQLFTPVLVAAALYAMSYRLAAFITFQLFIEGFALWQLGIGLVLFRPELNVSKKWFVFNMVFAMTYRLITNGYQVYHYYHHGEFFPIEKLLWITPIHLYASMGVVYCFYINARLIRHAQNKIGQAVLSVKQIFLRLLLFPWGMWWIQPRLNTLLKRA